MQTTTNYGLKKPDPQSDNVDITIINANMDTLDAQIKAVSNSIPSVPVTSVNNKTGTVNLTAGDVGAATPSQIPIKVSQLTNDTGFITSNAIPGSLPANGGNSTTVNNHSASATPGTTEKTDLIGMMNEVNNNLNTHESDNGRHVTKDGTLQLGLNADMVDSINSTDIGQLSVTKNWTTQQNFNAGAPVILSPNAHVASDLINTYPLGYSMFWLQNGANGFPITTLYGFVITFSFGGYGYQEVVEMYTGTDSTVKTRRWFREKRDSNNFWQPFEEIMTTATGPIVTNSSDNTTQYYLKYDGSSLYLQQV